jgi:hypothetical protein
MQRRRKGTRRWTAARSGSSSGSTRRCGCRGRGRWSSAFSRPLHRLPPPPSVSSASSWLESIVAILAAVNFFHRLVSCVTVVLSLCGLGLLSSISLWGVLRLPSRRFIYPLSVCCVVRLFLVLVLSKDNRCYLFCPGANTTSEMFLQLASINLTPKGATSISTCLFQLEGTARAGGRASSITEKVHHS